MQQKAYVLLGVGLLIGFGYYFSQPASNATPTSDEINSLLAPADTTATATEARTVATTTAVVSEQPTATATATTTEQTITNVTPDKKENVMITATLQTNKGAIVIELYGATAPNTAANFEKLAKEGFYDGTRFHRVISGFMIQGGDPLSKDEKMADRWGTGGPGYKFADEISAGNHNDVGTIAMANSGPNTNGSQFFINVAANNFLDGKHTVFGKVTKGMDVVSAIEHIQTDSNDRPVDSVVIEKVVIQ